MEPTFEAQFNTALGIWDEGDWEWAAELFQALEPFAPHPTARKATVGVIAAILVENHAYERALPYALRSVTLSPTSELSSLGLFWCWVNFERDDLAWEEAIRYTRLNGYSAEYSHLVALCWPMVPEELLELVNECRPGSA